MSGYRGYLTVQQIADFVDTIQYHDVENEVDMVYIEPPADGNESDEDDADADEENSTQRELGKKQQESQGEIVMTRVANENLFENPVMIEPAGLNEALAKIMTSSLANLDIDLIRSSPATSKVYNSEEKVSPIPTSMFYRSTEVHPNPSKVSPISASETPLQQSSSASASAPNPTDAPASKRTKRPSAPEILWLEDVEEGQRPCFAYEEDWTDCYDVEPYLLFEKIFDDEVIKMMVEQTNSYAVFRGQPNPSISEAEMKAFIGILIVSSYRVAPSNWCFWSDQLDLRNEMVCQTMHRDRFETILRFLHFIDYSEENANDKMWKLRPLTDALKSRFARNFHPEQDLSYGESIIQYFGRKGGTQFIRNEHLRFGYKVLCLNTQLGYLVNFEIHQGNNPRLNADYVTKYGKSISPLFNMLDEFDPSIKNLEFCFYFDQLFTSVPALIGFRQRGYHATGKIQENAIPANCPLPDKKAMKKMAKGSIESAKMDGSGIIITKGSNNTAVASTVFGKFPVVNSNRLSKGDFGKTQVPSANVIKEYKYGMAGTDRMRERDYVNDYRISIRGKKWWSSIFTWLIDVSIQNAWFLHCRAGVSNGSPLSQLEFRRQIASRYCALRRPANNRTPRSPYEFNPRS